VRRGWWRLSLKMRCGSRCMQSFHISIRGAGRAERSTRFARASISDAGAVVVLVEVAFNRRELTFADCGLYGTLAEC
jgi:hypothetical protein